MRVVPRVSTACNLTWLKFADLGRARSPDLRFPRADGVNVRTKRPPSRPSAMAPP